MKLIYSLLLLAGVASAQIEADDQPLNLPGILGKWAPVDKTGVMPGNQAPRTQGLKWIHFLPNNKVEWSVKIAPTSIPKIRHGNYTLSHSGNIVHHSTKRVLLRIDPFPYNPKVGGVREDGTPIFLTDVRVGKGIDNRFSRQTELLKFCTQDTALVFTKSNSKQDKAETQLSGDVAALREAMKGEIDLRTLSEHFQIVQSMHADYFGPPDEIGGEATSVMNWFFAADGLIYRVHHDGRVVRLDSPPNWVKSMKTGNLNGDSQPAIDPESKPEDDQNPKPESDARPL